MKIKTIGIVFLDEEEFNSKEFSFACSEMGILKNKIRNNNMFFVFNLLLEDMKSFASLLKKDSFSFCNVISTENFKFLTFLNKQGNSFVKDSHLSLTDKQKEVLKKEINFFEERLKSVNNMELEFSLDSSRTVKSRCLHRRNIFNEQ